ncbi:MAG TPA: hypothetical protein VLX92_29675 [Kofleriaceae bacterium]|nr:hypothetical protein [Kofleriaceae bacterium]
MMRLAIAALLVGCGTGQPLPPSNTTPIQCGSGTCEPGNYCAQVCTCCGIPGGTPSGYSECRTIPTTCTSDTGDALRDCLEQQTGGETLDNEDPRMVSFPCA